VIPHYFLLRRLARSGRQRLLVSLEQLETTSLSWDVETRPILIWTRRIGLSSRIPSLITLTRDLGSCLLT
jgi:hypothetical protein